MNVAGIVLAAGYGHLRKEGGQPVWKVLEKINGVPLVYRSVLTLQAASIDHIVVVVNPLSYDGVRQSIGESVQYVVQPERSGTADAVARAARVLTDQHAVVVFGDMPLWKSRTVRQVVEAYRREPSIAAMAVIDLNEVHPSEVEHYGRVFFNGDGSITTIAEPGDLSPEQQAAARTANPSLYCFDLDWLVGRVGQVPSDARDGFTPERHLPFLIPMAFQEGRHVAQVVLEDAREALGVNSAEELARARRLAKVLRI